VDELPGIHLLGTWVNNSQTGALRSAEWHDLPMWETLAEPWRACVDLAWKAYRAGSLPIGAVVTDVSGNLLSRGRNRIHERFGEGGTLFGHKLAHAEVNALVKLDYDRHDPRACTLWSTTEPCPLCVGALRMADLAELRYASREPWAGSAAMFETVPYLKNGNVRVFGPPDRRTEAVLVALQVERFLHLKPEVLEQFLRLYQEVMPEATLAGRRLYRSGILQTLSKEQATVSEALLVVNAEIATIA
jgi:tRNA(adenine34) deaminase